jgi:acyl-coenzyme A synthetase/AMP-(fatty) acid ligase
MRLTLPAAASAGAAHSPALLAAIAARLAALADDAEAFGLVLCSDGNVAGRYLVQLQQIDRLSQSLREVAMVLEAAEPDNAVAAIRLGDLRDALEQVDAI